MCLDIHEMRKQHGHRCHEKKSKPFREITTRWENKTEMHRHDLEGGRN